jgi:hypothetical protein
MYQLRSMICLSKTSLATMSGLADFVCQTETDRSSAPSATTEQMLDVETGACALRRKICGLYAYTLKCQCHSCYRNDPLTATSTVFSCPTRLISDVHVLRVMTAAMKQGLGCL